VFGDVAGDVGQRPDCFILELRVLLALQERNEQGDQVAVDDGLHGRVVLDGGQLPEPDHGAQFLGVIVAVDQLSQLGDQVEVLAVLVHVDFERGHFGEQLA